MLPPDRSAGTGRPSDGESHREGLENLLARYPSAAVMALNPDALCAAWPDAIRLNGQRVLESRSLGDWMVADDRAKVAKAWFDVRSSGRSEASVRLLSLPGVWVTLRLFNLFDSHALVAAVIVPVDRQGDAVELGAPTFARSRLASYRQDNAGVIVDCDDRSAAMFGFERDVLVGSQGLFLVHAADQALVIEAWLEAMATKRPVTARYRHKCAPDSWLWVDGTITNQLGQPGRNHILIELVDVSEAMAAKEALQARETLLARLAQALPLGICQIDEHRKVVYSNERLFAILGTPNSDHLDALFATVHSADRATLDDLLARALECGADSDLDVRLELPGNLPRRCHMNVRTLDGGPSRQAGVIVCVADSTESAQMREALEVRANVDVLTRCSNREATMRALALALAAGGTGQAGVIFIDVDGFKSVNDVLGHAAGDELLVAVARLFGAALRPDDVLGRIGGDEFLIVCRHVDGPQELMLLARRMASSLDELLPIAGTLVKSRASIGAACSARGMTADALVALADGAMYQSKRQGLGQPVFARGDSESPRASSRSTPPTSLRIEQSG